MNEITFKIIILFYNKSNLTIKCLDNLVGNFTRKKDFFYNIILVNNGSTDLHLQNVQNKMGDLNKDCFIKEHTLIRISSVYPNKGFGSGMNHGLKLHFADNADFVLCLSNDVELDINFFDNYYNMKKKYSSGNSSVLVMPPILCPHTYYLMDKTKLSYTHGILKNENDDLDLSHEKDLSKKEIIFPEYYPAAAAIWSKEAFEQTGGFNEKFYCYWEDVELSYRCNNLNIKLISVPELKIFHLGRGTTSGKSSYYNHYIKGKEIMKKILNKKIT